MSERGKAISVLAANTLAFTVCFAVWMMNGVLITFLVDNGVYDFDKAQMGWLIGIPVLTGAIFRLPAGMLTDRFGGRGVFVVVMLLTAAAAFLDSYARRFLGIHRRRAGVRARRHFVRRRHRLLFGLVSPNTNKARRLASSERATPALRSPRWAPH